METNDKINLNAIINPAKPQVLLFDRIHHRNQLNDEDIGVNRAAENLCLLRDDNDFLYMLIIAFKRHLETGVSPVLFNNIMRDPSATMSSNFIIKYLLKLK